MENIETQEMEQSLILTNTDINTGTTDIVGNIESEDIDNLGGAEEAFENLSNSIEDIDINEEEIELDNSPVTDEELNDYINDSDNVISVLTDDDKVPEISIESTKQLLTLINKKIANENVNPYRDMPQEIKDIIDKHVNKAMFDQSIPRNNINQFKNQIAETLLNDFINDVQLKRIKNDFETDMENLYKDSIKDIAAGTKEFIDERNKLYREAADDIEDDEKRKKMLDLLDQIDEARSLTSLKEYAKHCRIKYIELEKPENRIYSNFLYKYKNSTNNIYDINLAKKVLLRHFEPEGYRVKDIDAFLIAFCKQVKNYSPSIPVQHVYMYYVLYYCALLDGDNSDIFKNNIKEVIANLKERNSSALK